MEGPGNSFVARMKPARVDAWPADLQGVTAQIQAIRTGQGYQHPYDLGIAENLANILGHNPMGWWLPGLAAKGAGLAYSTVWDQERFDAGFLGL